MERLTPDDFRGLICTVLTKGVAFRERLSPDTLTEHLAQALGEPVGFNWNSPVHTLAPKSMDEAPFNTYSGIYGLGEFPLHTDMANWHQPPRYVMLRCIVGTAEVTTTVVDPSPVIDAIGVENLTRALMKPRRRVSGRMSLLSIAERLHDGTMIRWDERFLQPASRAGKIYAAEISQRLRGLVVTPIVLAHPGDTVVIDNWKMLHGRAAVPEGHRSRQIERVYLKALAQ